MEKQFAGKTAVITGASRGIGRAIALKMAENGANVAIIYASDDAQAEEVRTLAEAASGGIAKCYKCDVSDFERTKELIFGITGDFGKIDILVNNAGIVRDGLLISMREDDFDIVMDINLKGAFNMMRHVCPLFVRKKSGRIINITSVSGMMGNPGQANYSAAKAGLIGLTKTTAKELASRGITCNAIAPGFIATDMTEAMPAEVKEKAAEQIPMKRMGMPDEIANLAVFLAGEGAAYITGEVIKIDGGLYI